MAQQTIPGGFVVMAFPNTVNTQPNIVGTVLIMDAANEDVAYVFRAPRTGNIRKPHFLLTTVTSAPTNSHDVRIETVDAATGLSTGTLVNANANVSQLLDTTGWKSPTLTADAAVTKGTMYALVVKAPAANFGNVGLGTFADQIGDYPYTLVAGAKAAVTASGVYALEYDDGTFDAIPGVWPMSAINTRSTFNTGSTPDRRALRFKWPCATRLIGCQVWIDADGDFDVVLYDSDGVTATTLLSVDKDLRASTNASVQHLRFTTNFDIVKDTWYRLAIVPSSATNATLYDFDVASAAILDAHPGGQNFHSSTATNAPAAEGDWTQVLTQRPFIAPIFDQVDDGASSGGTNRAALPSGLSALG